MSGRLRIRWSKSFTKIHSYRLPLDCYFGFPMSSSCLPLDYLLDDTPLNCSTRQNTEDLFNGPKAYFQDLREDKMTNALVGKATVSITCIAPTENAAETMREFFKDHMEFMRAKSHQEGPLKLLMYSISESPEWKENTSWTEGKYPEKTGRTVFNLYEIYDNEEGLHHHWIESAEYLPVFTQLAEVHQIEWLIFNQMKVTQSLWD